MKPEDSGNIVHFPLLYRFGFLAEEVRNGLALLCAAEKLLPRHFDKNLVAENADA